LGPLIEAAGQKSVETVCYARDHEGSQRQEKTLIENERNKYGDEDHPEDGEHIRDGNDPGGH
jgi:hypothetical protein